MWQPVEFLNVFNTKIPSRLVNSAWDAYLPVHDHSFVYGHYVSTIFQSNLEPGLKPSSSIHVSVSFWFLLLDLISCRTGILSLTFPNL